MGAAALAIRPFAWAAPDPSKFYFALIADTHIIDSFYKGPEGNPEDTESIFKTAERLIAARSLINSLTPRMEQVFLVGDYFHNYPSPDIDFYFQHQTRIDQAKAITDAFQMPVHAGFGNHDYAESQCRARCRTSYSGVNLASSRITRWNIADGNSSI